MAVIEINPAYREFLEAYGLTAFDVLHGLSGEIICGHPSRHVVQVTIGSGLETLQGILKRQHWITWRQRLANAWAGYGLVADSRREGRMLQHLRRAGVACPDWIAAGEDERGRAFLLLRAVEGAVDLGTFLRSQRSESSRRRFARNLCETLAHMHEAGFQHRDLYAKHILVNPRDWRLHIVDWQRARYHRFLAWGQRWQDLAALHATLADNLTSPSERLVFLKAYLQAVVPVRAPRAFCRRAVYMIEHEAQRLLQRRQVREQRETKLAIGAQRLIWLDGEALCVTPEFYSAVRQQIPEWLAVASSPQVSGNYVRRSIVNVPGASSATLVQRCVTMVLSRLWSWWPGKPYASPEMRQLGLLFRLQRQGIATPRLLAFGQKQSAPGRIGSFLLTDGPAGALRLKSWLARQTGQALQGEEREQRWQLFREVGILLRKMHDANCCFENRAATQPGDDHVPAVDQLLVLPRQGGVSQLALASVDSLIWECRDRPKRVHRDLQSLCASMPRNLYSRTDALRFFLAYHDRKRLDSSAKQIAERWLATWSKPA
jgi:tRNA A-37 threonylcarbamoyl transferase component Bud32